MQTQFKIGDIVTPANVSHPDHGKRFKVCDIRDNRAIEAIADRFGLPGHPEVPAYTTVAAFKTATYCEDYPLHMSPDGWMWL